MSRFNHPKSSRYGTFSDWQRVSESPRGFLKVQPFLEYLYVLLKDELYVEEGVVLNEVSIEPEGDVITVKVELYDRTLELNLRELQTESGEKAKRVEQLLGNKLVVLKRLINSEGGKYFGKEVNVVFNFLDFKSLGSVGLSRFIALNLERGHNLVGIIKLLANEFRHLGLMGGKAVDKPSSNLDLTHRYPVVYGEGVRTFEPVSVGDRYLLGYRLEVVGRYSRKQRASKRTVSEGKVPLGSFTGSMDFGMSEAIMDYGVSSVRVWLYYDRDKSRMKYLCSCY